MKLKAVDEACKVAWSLPYFLRHTSGPPAAFGNIVGPSYVLAMEALNRSGPRASASQRCLGIHPCNHHQLAATIRRRPMNQTLRNRATDTEAGGPSDNPDVLRRWREMWDMDQPKPTQMAEDSFTINNPYNKEPDVLNDPDWQDKVTDWHEFWTNQKWDLELEGVDDEVDVGGNALTSKERIVRLIDSIKDNRLRADVMQWMPPQSDVHQHLGTWDVPPVLPERSPLNPGYTSNDLRAIAEKKAWKAMMDTEWHRRQSMVGRLTYPDPYKDIRLEHFGTQFSDMDWGRKRIYNLITLGGTAARPEDHGGFVENPLVPIDYVQTMGVHYIEETEDFLERVGHLATPEDEDRFDQEVVLDCMDDLGMTVDDLVDDIESDLGEGDEDDDDEDDEGEDGEGEDGEGGEVEDDEEVEQEQDGDGY